jgi:hypothetical protein
VAHQWHVKNNPHHLEYYISRGISHIPEKYVLEILADWEGVKRTLNADNKNYDLNRDMYNFLYDNMLGFSIDEETNEFKLDNNGFPMRNMLEHFDDQTKGYFLDNLKKFYPVSKFFELGVKQTAAARKMAIVRKPFASVLNAALVASR